MRGDETDRSPRRDPEALLRRVEASERSERRGQLKIFLGYASGVGKSFRLFDEGRRRRERGEDVVVGARQTDMPADVARLVRRLTVIPCRDVGDSPVIDVAAILTRHPQVCLIDGLAYDNPPGSRHARRYEDVEELLDAGISVVTSINLEYIAEQQEFVRSVLGKAPSQTVPQIFIDRADEVVVVDAPPEAATAVEEHDLSRLRQRALLLTADVVDRQLEAYLRLNGIQLSWGTQERILVCMTPRANAARMLASGRRNADRFHGELFAIYVRQPNLTDEDRTALERNVMLADAQGAHLDTLEGRDPVDAILQYRGSRFEDMDTDAVRRRHPQVAVVDELPHTNVPGSSRLKRWEDVHVLLEAGIDVLTTMNVQHLESLNDQIRQSAGVRVRETVPDWVVKQADEVVMVDLTPRALLNRLERGVVYPPERVQAALQNFFKESTLVALRELAMRQTAHTVESRQADEAAAIALPATGGGPDEHERLLLLIGPDPASAALIRRGRRVADYLRADCLAVYVSRGPGLSHLTDPDRTGLEQQLNFARGLQIDTRVLAGADEAETLVSFARVNRVTQIFVMRRNDHWLSSFFGRGLVQRMVRLAPDMQVTVVADRSSRPETSPDSNRRFDGT